MKKINCIFFLILFSCIYLQAQEQVCEQVTEYIHRSWNKKALAIISKSDFDPNCIDEFGTSPLGIAANMGSLRIVKELLKKGASPNLKQRGKYYWGETPLHDACFIYSQELDESLKLNRPKRTFDYKIKDDIVKLMLYYGADVNIKDDNNNTALHIASRHRRKFAVIILIEAGTNINAQDINGNTALISAIQNNDPDILRLLLEAGANKDIKNNNGETALSIAKRNNNHLIVSILNLSL